MLSSVLDRCQRGLRPAGVKFWMLMVLCGAVCGDSAAEAPAHRDSRVAAWHQAIVSINEIRPGAALLSYPIRKVPAHHHYVALELDPGVDGRFTADAEDVRVTERPGTVQAAFRLGEVRVFTEITPLMTGRRRDTWEGAALYSVRTDPPTALTVRMGGHTQTRLMTPDNVHLTDGVPAEGNEASIDGGVATLTRANWPLAVAVRGSGELSAGEGDAPLTGRFESGAGLLVLAFSDVTTRAQQLARETAPREAAGEVERFYRELFAGAHIETPVGDLDEAFRWALVALEYNWVYPYGWNEAIHHWLAMWHMQHSPGVQWIGHVERARTSIVEHAGNLVADGAVPQFTADGRTRRDFGGSNQFYMWQVRRFWEFTGDRRTVFDLAPALDRIIEQTFAEYDPDGNGLLGWGSQIGNQEDLIHTPYDGTTPSVEAINMLRTRREVARRMGEEDRARELQWRIDEIRDRLREKLWLKDLGRFAFFRDPHGVARLDAQYHALIYPYLFDVADMFDGYTSLRHLRERLTGPDGMVYGSNQFAHHLNCTCGMQGGAAQQPWAAWGLAEMGLREEAWRPLAAIARKVMDADHRGAWPEVAAEPTPAHFSPPAGLYVAAVIEALFGLYADVPGGLLRVQPCFPEAWPEARLTLSEYRAHYTREGETMRYVVESDRTLTRRLDWHLPPCRIRSLQIDGEEVRPRTLFHIGGVRLVNSTDPSTRTVFELTIEPLEYSIETPTTVAAGELLSIRAEGVRLAGIDDRCGVLDSYLKPQEGEQAIARVAPELLEPYRGYGRLGLMNFSRRTFFLLCQAEDATSFWHPVDLTVLPRYEAAQAGPLRLEGEKIRVPLMVRNNRNGRLLGTAGLELAGGRFAAELDLPRGAESTLEVELPATHLLLLAAGDNTAVLALPGGEKIELTIDAGDVFAQAGVERIVRERIATIALPEDRLIEDTAIDGVRPFRAWGEGHFREFAPNLAALEGRERFAMPDLTLVEFEPAGRRVAPVSWHTGRPVLRVDLGDEIYRKLYVLVAPLLNNHDAWAPVARVAARVADGGVIERTLHTPGDLDWAETDAMLGHMYATGFGGREDRHGSAPRPDATTGDWAEARPPAYPQRKWWASCRDFRQSPTRLNLIELDLGRPAQVRDLTIETIGTDPGLAVVAVAAERPAGDLSDVPERLRPPEELRPPRLLFEFAEPGATLGWELEGAFEVGPIPALVREVTLNSLARGGETATGRAISPRFVADAAMLRVTWMGGRPQAEAGPGALHLRVLDAETGEVLHRAEPPGSHLSQVTHIATGAWRGRAVRIELVDEHTATSFAWIGLRRVELAWR